MARGEKNGKRGRSRGVTPVALLGGLDSQEGDEKDGEEGAARASVMVPITGEMCLPEDL